MNVAVIADDLTGANADGALLTAKGISSATCLDLGVWNPEEFAEYAAVAVSMDSRLLAPAEAKAKFREAARLFAGQKPAVLAKRMDSTLRGNVGAEIEGALEGMDEVAGPGGEKAVAVVVPAYPGSGRIAAGGYLIVHGIPLERSPIARDAATPVNSSSTVRVIGEQSSFPCGFISLTTILAGTNAVRSEMLRLWREGLRIVVCDAVTDDDILTLAESLRDVPFPVLAVSPGPFTAEMAAVRLASRQSKGRVLAVIGSTSELTRRQIETLRLAHPCHFTRVDCEKLLDASTREAAMDTAVARLAAAPEEAAVIGVCTAEKPEDVFSMDELSRKHALAPSEISHRINKALADIADRLLARPELHLRGLYSSGGEVTVATIRTLGGTGFSVRAQVIPLAVYGRLLRGRYPGLPMVTKGGFVGDGGSLVECVNFLFSQIVSNHSQ